MVNVEIGLGQHFGEAFAGVGLFGLIDGGEAAGKCGKNLGGTIVRLTAGAQTLLDLGEASIVCDGRLAPGPRGALELVGLLADILNAPIIAISGVHEDVGVFVGVPAGMGEVLQAIAIGLGFFRGRWRC